MRLLITILLTVHASLALGQQDMSEIDPWESTNRKIFAFNRFFDRTLLRPVASGYAKLMPDAAERSVANAVANVYEVNRFINSLLQGRPDAAAVSTGRFMVNTTVGVFGLFDVATRMGIEVQRADFGQTLMVWGFGSGPYVILPFFGPRTVRSATGYVVDTYASIPAVAWDTTSAYAFWSAEAISFRAGLLEFDELVTGDEYVFMRSAYLQARATFLNNGIPPLEDFADDEYDLDWDDEL